jgi:hypothetical protein
VNIILLDHGLYAVSFNTVTWTSFI